MQKFDFICDFFDYFIIRKQSVFDLLCLRFTLNQLVHMNMLYLLDFIEFLVGIRYWLKG